MKRTVISKKMFEALVKKGVVIRVDDCYYCKYQDFSNCLTALDLNEQMYEDLVHSRKHGVELHSECQNPMELCSGKGWFVPEWIFVDRQEDLLKDYEEKEKDTERV